MATRIAAADPRVPGQVAAQGHPVVKTVIVPAEPAVRFVARQHPQAAQAPDSGVGSREVSPLAARSVCSADLLQGFDSGLVPVAP
jgi:hypothetical protein